MGCGSGFNVWEQLDEDKEVFQASLNCGSAFRLPFLESVVRLDLCRSLPAQGIP